MTSLKQSAVSGVKWTGISTAVITGLQFLQYAILTRLLVPEDFGLMAMTTVVTGFAQAFGDMGISNAIIHRQDVTRRQLSSLYWLNLAASLTVFALVMAALPLIVSFYREPRLKSLVFLAALVFLIVPVGRQFQVLLQKELQFARLAQVEVSSTVIGTGVAIASALFDQGVFSLIWGQLASAAWKSTVLAWLGWRNWRPRLHFSREDLKGYLSFGLYQMGEGSVNYFSANTDYLIIGRFLGPEILGLYTLAYQLVLMPLFKLNPIVTRVAFPVFAKRQWEAGALRRGYLEMIKLLALLIFPILIGLGVTAPLMLPLIFGQGWGPAIPLLQILVFVGILKALGNPSGSVLLAKGRADIGFKWNVLVAVINPFVFWFAVRYGVFAVSWSYVILSMIYFIIGQIILRFQIGLGWLEFLAVLIKPAGMSVAMGATVYAAYLFCVKSFTPGLPLLLGLVALGAGEYALLAVLFEAKFLLEIWRLLINKKQEVQ